MFKFSKVLAKYYEKWYRDSLASAEYCERNGNKVKAEQYRLEAEEYRKLIEENKEAIEFFKNDYNAFTPDKNLPEKFRGYK